MYLFLTFSYLSYLSLYVQAKYLSGGIEDYIGIFLGVFFLLLGVFYVILFTMSTREEFFLEFKDKFRK